MLDMERTANGQLIHGADGLRGRGCTRMRPTLNLPLPALQWARFSGHAGCVMEWPVTWGAVLSRCHIDLFKDGRFKPVDTSGVA
jgi:hypothetical protein